MPYNARQVLFTRINIPTLINDHQDNICEFYKGSTLSILRPTKKRCLFPVTRPSLGNGSDPGLFLCTLNTRKTLFSQFLIFIFLQNGFFLRFPPPKSSLAKKRTKKRMKKIRTTYPNCCGHVTGNKHLFCLGLSTN